MASKPTTKAPSGLSIARDNWKYTFSWKIADTDYNAGQQFAYRIHIGSKDKKGKYVWEKWNFISIGNQTTSKAVWLSASNFFPSTYKDSKNKTRIRPTLYAIQFGVRGRRAATTKDNVKTTYPWSSWSYCQWYIYVPMMPSVTSTLDNELENVCTFTWNVEVASDNKRPFTNVEWQTILVKGSNQGDGSKLSWKSSQLGWATGTGNRNSSKTFTEDSYTLSRDPYSYTRWFRVRSKGPGGYGDAQGAKLTGCSYWRYAKHVYAIPKAPVINKIEHSGSWTVLKWTADASNGRPIDYTTVEYAVGIPRANLTVPLNPSWQAIHTFRDTGGADGCTFNTYVNLEPDQCMWYRIGVTHDSTTKYSSAAIDFKASLKAPSISVTDINQANNKATIHITHNSEVPDSRTAILFRHPDRTYDECIAIYSHDVTDFTVTCPEWGAGTSPTFRAYEFVGSYTYTTTGGVSYYTVTSKMRSATVSAGQVPNVPTNVSAAATENEGEVLVKWSWPSRWNGTQAEISWSADQNAWESTNQPSTYTVDIIKNPRLRVSGLESGYTYYFRVRFILDQNVDTAQYGPYSDAVSVALTVKEMEDVVVPVLTAKNQVVAAGVDIELSWEFSGGNNSTQAYAEICEVTYVNNEAVYGNAIAHTLTEQSAVVPNTYNTGEQHYFSVRIKTDSEDMSGWSEPVSIDIAELVTCQINDVPFEEITIGEGDEERTVLSLTEMPFSIGVDGPKENENLSIFIKRAADYHMARPDETEFNGFEGETIYAYSQTGSVQSEYVLSQDSSVITGKTYYARTGEGTSASPYEYSLIEEPSGNPSSNGYYEITNTGNTITVTNDSLIGYLDDGAAYKLVAIVTDSLGQTATDEKNFEVHWEHQALIPNGLVEILEEHRVAKITPIAPVGTIESDACDIYRLSIDKPELVYSGAVFGTSYVDPYPAIGEFGGYRFVFRTANNDYITENNVIAWYDAEANFNTLDNIIDFGGSTVNLRYNVDLSNAWAKEFNETHYLGGSVQGDWNPAVSRTGSVSGVAVISTDQETIESMRRLAVYAGVCHIRTRDGSSFDANVDVSENRGHEPGDLTASFNLSVTRVDPEMPAGIPYAQWVETIQEE